MLVDTHCHLYFNAFDEDRDQVLQRAREAGVGRILTPGIDLDSSRQAVGLAEAQAEVFAAVGVHPNDSLAWQAGTVESLRDLAQHPKVVAIGEIGIDDYWDRAPRDHQEQVFRRQLALAAELGKPVVIHIRNRTADERQAAKDTLSILMEWQTGLAAAGHPLAEAPGVLHSFSDREEIARQAIAVNFFIGITGPVTFRNAPDLQRLVEELPLDRILIETDAPFLTPHPYRGRRNEPCHVRLVAEKIAQLRNLPLETVMEITAQNAGRLFHWQAKY